MIQTLIESRECQGMYVALKAFNKREIVGKGATPQEAYDSAERKGFKSPVITFIATKNMVQIY